LPATDPGGALRETSYRKIMVRANEFSRIPHDPE
jgi:hypothetical protein